MNQILLPDTAPITQPLTPQGFLVCSDAETVVSPEIIREFLRRNHVVIVPPELLQEFIGTEYRNPNCFFGIRTLADFQGLIDALLRLSEQDKVTEEPRLSIAIMGPNSHLESVDKLASQVLSCEFVYNLMSPNTHTSSRVYGLTYLGFTHIRVGPGVVDPITEVGAKSLEPTDLPYLRGNLDQAGHTAIKLVADFDPCGVAELNRMVINGADMVVIHSLLLDTWESGGWDYDTGLTQMGKLTVVTAEPHRRKEVAGELIHPEHYVGEVVDWFEGGLGKLLSFLGTTR